jgi:hypothetical protein
MPRPFTLSLSSLTVVFTLTALLWSPVLAEAPAPAPSAESVETARKTIKILDEIYKRIIVLVTDKYVHDEEDFAAGSAAVLLFRQMSAGGTHQVRLLDATGEPYEPENVAKDDFEKNGIKALKGGAAEFERIEKKDGKSILRVMTPVPVVHERCVMCHDQYKNAKPGEPIGVLSYSIPLQ